MASGQNPQLTRVWPGSQGEPHRHEQAQRAPTKGWRSLERCSHNLPPSQIAEHATQPACCPPNRPHRDMNRYNELSRRAPGMSIAGAQAFYGPPRARGAGAQPAGRCPEGRRASERRPRPWLRGHGLLSAGDVYLTPPAVCGSLRCNGSETTGDSRSGSTGRGPPGAARPTSRHVRALYGRRCSVRPQQSQ